MDITFACESCGQHIVIDEAGKGLQVICPTCGLGITVPKPRQVGCPNLPPPPRQVPSHSSAGEADLPSVTHLLESFIPGSAFSLPLGLHGAKFGIRGVC